MELNGLLSLMQNHRTPDFHRDTAPVVEPGKALVEREFTSEPAAELLRYIVAEVGRHQCQHVLAEQLFAGHLLQLAGCGVDIQDRAVGRFQKHRVGGLFKQLAKLRLAFHQRLFDAFAVGDVAQEGHETPAFGGPVLDADFNLKNGPVFAPMPGLETVLAARDDLLDMGGGDVGLFGGFQVGNPQRQQLRHAVAAHPAIGSIGLQQAALRVHHPQAIHRRLENGPVSLLAGAQRLLVPLVLGNVREHRVDFPRLRLARTIYGHRVNADPAVVTKLRIEHPHHHAANWLAAAQRHHGRMLQAREDFPVLADRLPFHLDRIAAQEFLAAPAEDALGGRVHRDDSPVRALMDDALQHRFRQQPVAFFAGAQRRFGPLALGDVAQHDA